jgi:hypothetical protein
MNSIKGLLFGVILIIIVGVGGLVYRNAVEHPYQPGICPVDTLLCPDGTTVSRVGEACEFPTCAPPNISHADVGISYAIPEGYVATSSADASVIAEYEKPTDSWLPSQTITIRRFAVGTSTPLEVIRETAIGGASGEPVNPTRFTSTLINNRTFTVVSIERFEAVVTTAYYLARGSDVLRFDAIDRDVLNWTDPTLDISTLPAHTALRSILSTLQVR